MSDILTDLSAPALGEGVYRQLGFQEYCRMSHYQ